MFYAVSKQLVRAVFRVLWPTEVKGLENVPVDGPVIIASNHRAFIDSIIIPMVVPRRVAFIAKAEYFTGTGLRGAVDKWFFTMVGAIPVDRARSATATASLEQAVEVLKDGLAFGIYPEGTRSRSGHLYRGRTGVAWLALDQEVPVVPTGIMGTAEAQSIKDNSLRPFKRLSVEFGEPVSPRDYAHLKPAVARRQLTDEVMDRIAAMIDQPRASGYHPPKARAGSPASSGPATPEDADETHQVIDLRDSATPSTGQ